MSPRTGDCREALGERDPDVEDEPAEREEGGGGSQPRTVPRRLIVTAGMQQRDGQAEVRSRREGVAIAGPAPAGGARRRRNRRTQSAQPPRRARENAAAVQRTEDFLERNGRRRLVAGDAIPRTRRRRPMLLPHSPQSPVSRRRLPVFPLSPTARGLAARCARCRMRRAEGDTRKHWRHVHHQAAALDGGRMFGALGPARGALLMDGSAPAGPRGSR